VNFLQLCQRVFSEGGITGQITSCENQTGEALRVVNWVSEAYQQILKNQAMNWMFSHQSFTKQLTPGKGAYTFAELGVDRGVKWDTRSMRVAINPDMSDETFLQHMGFPAFRDYWLFSSRRSVESRPLNATSDTQINLRIAPLPADAYWLDFQCEVSAAPLVRNDDTPVFPERFHIAIVWKALREYGMFEAAPEVVTRADTNFQTDIFQLELDQSDEVTAGEPIC